MMPRLASPRSPRRIMAMKDGKGRGCLGEELEPDISKEDIELILKTSSSPLSNQPFVTVNPFYEGGRDGAYLRDDGVPSASSGSSLMIDGGKSSLSSIESDGGDEEDTRLTRKRSIVLPDTVVGSQSEEEDASKMLPEGGKVERDCHSINYCGGISIDLLSKCSRFWNELNHVQFTKLNSSVMKQIEQVMSLQEIRTLSLVHCNLTRVPSVVATCKKLTHLDLSFNSIAEVKMTQLPRGCLVSLNLQSNQLLEYPLINQCKMDLVDQHGLRSLICIHLTDLNVSNNRSLPNTPPVEYPEYLPQLRRLDISRCPIVCIPTKWNKFQHKLKRLTLEWFAYTVPSSGIHLVKHHLSLFLQILGDKYERGDTYIDGLSAIRCMTDALNPNDDRLCVKHSLSILDLEVVEDYPLHKAVQNDDYAVLHLILNHRNCTKGMIDTLNRDKETPLCIAVRNSRHHMVSLLLDKGARDYHKRSEPLIHTAASNQDITTLKALVDAGADIHARDRGGNNLWHLLFQTFDEVSGPMIANLLLHHNVDSTLENKDHWAPIHLIETRSNNPRQDGLITHAERGSSAALDWCVGLLKQYQRRGNAAQETLPIEINQRTQTSRWSLLSIAAYYNSVKTVRSLLEHDDLVDPSLLNGGNGELLTTNLGLKLLWRRAISHRCLLGAEAGYRLDPWTNRDRVKALANGHKIVENSSSGAPGRYRRNVRGGDTTSTTSTRLCGPWGQFNVTSLMGTVRFDAVESMSSFSTDDVLSESLSAVTCAHDRDERGPTTLTNDATDFDDLFGHTIKDLSDESSPSSAALAPHAQLCYGQNDAYARLLDSNGDYVPSRLSRYGYTEPPRMFPCAFGLDVFTNPLSYYEHALTYDANDKSFQSVIDDRIHQVYASSECLTERGIDIIIQPESERYKAPYFRTDATFKIQQSSKHATLQSTMVKLQSIFYEFLFQNSFHCARRDSTILSSTLSSSCTIRTSLFELNSTEEARVKQEAPSTSSPRGSRTVDKHVLRIIHHLLIFKISPLILLKHFTPKNEEDVERPSMQDEGRKNNALLKGLFMLHLATKPTREDPSSSSMSLEPTTETSQNPLSWLLQQLYVNDTEGLSEAINCYNDRINSDRRVGLPNTHVEAPTIHHSDRYPSHLPLEQRSNPTMSTTPRLIKVLRGCGVDDSVVTECDTSMGGCFSRQSSVASSYREKKSSNEIDASPSLNPAKSTNINLISRRSLPTTWIQPTSSNTSKRMKKQRLYKGRTPSSCFRCQARQHLERPITCDFCAALPCDICLHALLNQRLTYVTSQNYQGNHLHPSYRMECIVPDDRSHKQQQSKHYQHKTRRQLCSECRELWQSVHTGLYCI